MPRLLTACFLSFLAATTAAPQDRESNDTLRFPVDLPTGDYALETAFWFDSALAIVAPPHRSDLLFFAERSGTIRIVDDLDSGQARPEPFLDISDRVTTRSENGLLGLAFHPNFAANGRFFVFYTTDASGSPTNRLSQFTRSIDSPLQADPNSERVLLDQRDQAANHNGGDLHFGNDGYLYVALGDEGGANDQYQNGQYVDKDFFAGLIRIDVDRLPGNLDPTPHPAVPLYDGSAAYRIPADNPLVPRWQDEGSDPDSPLRLEFFAIGLRNPWRFSIDRATGDIWLADVGQSRWEEVNLIEKGGNYGWPIREGAHDGPGSRSLPSGFSQPIDPTFEYDHSVGASITGGFVYRGSRFPELYGAYLFGDFINGQIWALQRSDDAVTTTQLASLSFHFAYGEDPRNGDILVSASSGQVARLVRGDGANGPDFPQTLSATGAFRDLTALAPEPGLYPYAPNLPFWSDGANKRRWVAIPTPSQIEFQVDAPWSFPTGSVWVKHFEWETEAGNPASRQRLETRFLIKTEQGAYGLSYRWNEAQTDATLAPPEGVSFDVPLLREGRQETRTWTIPSRQDCLRCHTEAAGFALSFNTRQLNRNHPHGDAERNTLAFFSRIGILDTPIDAPDALPRHVAMDDDSATLEQRARSYLAVNCAACHQPGGGAPNTWDARASLSMSETGLINAVPANDGGDPSKRLIVRGSPERSLLLDRMAGSAEMTRMPPIGSNRVDAQGLSLLRAWVELEPPSNRSFAEWQRLHFSDADSPRAAPEADPDGDGNSNRLEFLNRTEPLDPTDAWTPEFVLEDDSIVVEFPMAPGRRFLIQASDDLSTWTEWPVHGNPPQSDALEPIDARVAGPRPNDASEASFLRVVVEPLPNE